MMGKGLLIMIFGGIGIVGWILFNNNNRINQETEVISKVFNDYVARSNCNSAAELLLTKLADDNTYRANSEVTNNWFNSTITYTVYDTVVSADSLVKIRVKAVHNNSVHNVIVLTAPQSGFIPPSIKAAVTSNSDVETLGDIDIDGRDHDINGNLINNSGIVGIWTTQTYTQGGSSTVGGTDDSDNDYISGNPASSNVIKENQTFPGGYPSTPDKVLGGDTYGLTNGTLKALAQSGVGGSQYVTVPASLTYPLAGITYVELPSTTSGNLNKWTNANVNGSGILIVHNSSTNATIKTPFGSFKGLVIADDVDKWQANLIGAIVSLTTTPGSARLLGNSTGQIKYSKEAIVKNTKLVPLLQFGHGKHRLPVINWLE